MDGRIFTASNNTETAINAEIVGVISQHAAQFGELFALVLKEDQGNARSPADHITFAFDRAVAQMIAVHAPHLKGMADPSFADENAYFYERNEA